MATASCCTSTRGEKEGCNVLMYFCLRRGGINSSPLPCFRVRGKSIDDDVWTFFAEKISSPASDFPSPHAWGEGARRADEGRTAPTHSSARLRLHRYDMAPGDGSHGEIRHLNRTQGSQPGPPAVGGGGSRRAARMRKRNLRRWFVRDSGRHRYRPNDFHRYGFHRRGFCRRRFRVCPCLLRRRARGTTRRTAPAGTTA